MARKKSGKVRKTLGINMKKNIAVELERRAASMHLSVGAYCRMILQNWLAAGNKLHLVEK